MRNWRAGIAFPPYLGAVRGFPDTRISIVAALSSDDLPERARATETVIAAYRTPVIAVLERRWNMQPADAEDMAHDFFAHALDRSWLARYDPSKGRFRVFLRTCLLGFASTAHEASTRQKRGGGVTHVPLDDASAIAADDETTSMFDREWIRSVMTLALSALEQECLARGRDAAWRVFVAYDVEGSEGERPTYERLARDAGIPVTQVTNYLNSTRRRFREHVLTTLRGLTVSDAEYRDEARALLGPSVV